MVAIGAILAERCADPRVVAAIENYQVTDARDQEMLEDVRRPVSSRPFASGIMDLAPASTRRSGTSRTCAHKIVLAGNPPGYEVDRFLIFKVLGVASVIVWVR